jgi:hypothetical protein
MSIEKFERRGVMLGPVGDTLTPSAHAFRVFDGSSFTEGDVQESNEDRTYFGASPFDFTNTRGGFEGTCFLTLPTLPGAAGAPGQSPHRRALLPAAMEEVLDANRSTTTYRPISDNIPFVQAVFHHAGRRLRVPSGSANVTGAKLEIGQRPTFQLRLQGKYLPINTESVPTDYDLSAFAREALARDDNTEMWCLIYDQAGNTSRRVDLAGKMLSVDGGNEVQTDEYTGLAITEVTDRDPRFQARFAVRQADAIVPETIRDAGTRVEFWFRQYAPDGRYVEIYAQGQVEQVAVEDVQGRANYMLTCRAIPQLAGTEWALAFGESFRISNASLAAGEVSEAYTATLTSAGNGSGTLTWSVHAGTLPAGLTLNAASGAITGTPSAAGTSNVTFRVVDSRAGTPRSALRQYALTIAP